MNNDRSVFIIAGVQRCGQHLINNYIQAAYTNGVFKNDAPAHAPLANEGAYNFVPFANGHQLSRWPIQRWRNRLFPKDATKTLFKKYDCLSVGIENTVINSYWVDSVRNHFAEFLISPQNIFLIQVVRAPLNNIASIAKMWGPNGRYPLKNNLEKLIELVIQSTENYLTTTKDVPFEGINKKPSQNPDVSHIVYDRFISDHEYRAKVYHSLPLVTNAINSCETILDTKIQASSFDDSNRDFNNRYRSMQNDPWIKSVVTPALINLHEEFLQRALYNQ